MEKTNAVVALAALAHESRLDVFRLLVQAGSAGMPAGTIGERLGLPPATLSFHLNHLKQAELVTFRREGRSLIYSAAYPAMNGLLAYLTENCCDGDPASCGVGSLACAPASARQEAQEDVPGRAGRRRRRSA
jgi:DNA-binding transcriptional ArsR family regulator